MSTIEIAHDTRSPYLRLNGLDRHTEGAGKLFSTDSGNMHLLQGGVRSIWKATKSKDTYVCLYEEAPQQRRITFKHKYFDASGVEKHVEQEYIIWTPWIMYMIAALPTGASILYMYFMKDSMTNFDHPLYFPTIPNIYFRDATPGRVCNGAVASRTITEDGNIVWQGTIAGVMSDFWTSVYNDDIMHFENMVPFSIIQGLEDPGEADQMLPTIHYGMKNWETLDASQVLAIPYHYLFDLKFAYDKLSSEYGIVEENYDVGNFATRFQRLLNSANVLRR
jgi:hypothetical protein